MLSEKKNQPRGNAEISQFVDELCQRQNLLYLTEQTPLEKIQDFLTNASQRRLSVSKSLIKKLES